MYVIHKVCNVMRGILQLHAPSSLKRRLWNNEFAIGRWKCLESSPGDCVYSFVEKYANKGSILDLGCGSGSTALELGANSYGHYTGVDISDVAIETARKRSSECHRGEKNEFLQSDIVSYLPTAKYDVILLRDSIYYLPQAQIALVLKRYSAYLSSEDSVFVVRMYSRSGKYRAIIETIEANFCVLERFVADQSETLVLILQPFRKTV